MMTSRIEHLMAAASAVCNSPFRLRHMAQQSTGSRSAIVVDQGKAAAAVLFGAISLLGYGATGAQTAATDAQPRTAILIPGIHEPAEMRVPPRPTNTPNAPEKMLTEETDGGARTNDSTVLLPALGRVLAKFPDYSDGYAMRAGLLCAGGDRSAIFSDLNSALEHVDSSRIKESAASLLSMRAKIRLLDGDAAAALADLERAISSNLTSADKFVNSGATKPEQTASTCTWREPDMDALVQHFPTDYWVYLLRGLYFDFFTSCNDDDVLRKRALEDFRKAVETDQTAALPHYFAARSLLKWSFFKQGGMSNQQREAFYAAPLTELDKALAIDPRLLPALSERSSIYLRLKRFQQAIVDYNRYLEIDSNDAAALDGRGHAEMELGQITNAIADFTKTIEAQKGSDGAEYETRANAYMKVRQWDWAIKDLTVAISLEMGNQLLLMNIDQFRALYPEYKIASDERIARKLNRTFYGNIKYDQFSKKFLQENHGWALDPSLYLQRAGAYLSTGDWHSAALDFRRAEDGAPDFSKFLDDERWGEITPSLNGHVYIDLKTFDDARRDSARIWIKQVRETGDPGSYSLQQFELNCGTRRIRAISSADYDASGSLIGSRDSGSWQSIVPETFGEAVFNGVCRAN